MKNLRLEKVKDVPKIHIVWLTQEPLVQKYTIIPAQLRPT